MCVWIICFDIFLYGIESGLINNQPVHRENFKNRVKPNADSYEEYYNQIYSQKQGKYVTLQSVNFVTAVTFFIGENLNNQ